MPSCTFFGHRNVPDSIREPLRAAILDLIENKGVDSFLVGNQGGFDSMVLKILREVTAEHATLRYAVVLAYHPTEDNLGCTVKPEETILPEEIAVIHPRFAIDKRNRWMVERCEYVIAYATHHGGAMKFTELAEKKGKTVTRLA